MAGPGASVDSVRRWRERGSAKLDFSCCFLFVCWNMFLEGVSDAASAVIVAAPKDPTAGGIDFLSGAAYLVFLFR